MPYSDPSGPGTVIEDGRLQREFLEDLEFRRQLSAHTVNSYSSDLSKFQNYIHAAAKSELLRCTRDNVIDYIISLEKSGLSARSRSRNLSVLRSFFAYLRFKGKITANPLDGIHGPSLNKSLPEYLTIEEINLLLKAGLDGDKFQRRTGMLVELLYASGARISEALSLKIENVNLNAGLIIIESGKGAKARQSLLPPVTCSNLKHYMEEIRPLILSNAVHRTTCLFPSRSGAKMQRPNAWKDIKRLAKSVGIGDKVHPHVLRHSFATHLIENDCDIRSVQFLLGHADISTTEIYTHVIEEKKRKVFRDAHPRSRRNRD